MPSPFPGMDPWLEGEEIFPDLHLRIIYLISEILNESMPRGYVANSANRVWVDDEQRREPDVSLFGPQDTASAGTATLSLPGMTSLGIAPTIEPWEEPYLEIRSTQGRRLVTAVEVLSLSNKKANSTGRTAYLDKQQEYQLGGVNIVEIDLLRGGKHSSRIELDLLHQRLGVFDYHVSVTVVGAPTRFFAAAAILEHPLPTIGIPLDPGVESVSINLQSILNRAYLSGRYSAMVNYRQPCDPPLTPEQQTWAEEILREKGVLP